MNNTGNGTLIISLDFEMTWGGVGIWDTSAYKETNVANVRQVVTRMLDLFNKYGVKATFATVGLIMLKDKSEALNSVPGLVPTYNNKALSPYNNRYIESICDESLYFAPDILSLLKRNDSIEIGTHTFSHYYCWENGQTLEQFEKDVEQAVQVARDRGLVLKSIIFPKNQVSAEYLSICAKYGISSYRGNAEKFYNQTSNRIKYFFNRIGRFLDSYVNIGGKTSYLLADIKTNGEPLNLRASRFLRPYDSRFGILDSLKINRVCNEIKYSAKHNEIYHLWWHPHNMGKDMDKNFEGLEKILQCYSQCHEKYGMRSCTMEEVSKSFLEDIQL